MHGVTRVCMRRWLPAAVLRAAGFCGPCRVREPPTLVGVRVKRRPGRDRAGPGQFFSSRGLELAAEFFRLEGRRVVAFIPSHYLRMIRVGGGV